MDKIDTVFLKYISNILLQYYKYVFKRIKIGNHICVEALTSFQFPFPQLHHVNFYIPSGKSMSALKGSTSLRYKVNCPTFLPLHYYKLKKQDYA